MTGPVLSRAALAALLWAALWRDPAPATLLVGAGLGLGTIWLVPVGTRRIRLRPWPAIALAGHLAVDLLRSSVAVAWEVITPTDRSRPGIVAVRLGPVSDAVLAVTAAAVTCTPGTAVVDVRRDTAVLHVHALRLDDPDRTAARVQALAARAAALFGPERSGDRR